MALSNDEALIERIAAALALRPRSSLQELAKAAGISRATLYRFVPTREQLLSVLTGYAVSLMKRTLDEADLENGKPYGCLSHVTQAFLQHRDVYSFFFTHSVEEALARGALYFAMPEWRFFDERMESFFLRCQKEGFLRIDMQTNLLSHPLHLPNGSVLRNRLVKAAMSETLGTYDNRPTPDLVRLYTRWAASGLGMIITGNVMITTRTMKFLKGVENDGTKAWIDTHRGEYDAARAEVLQAAISLIAESTRVDERIPDNQGEPRRCVSRLNRDARFAKGKSDYKSEFFIMTSLGINPNS